MKQAFPITDAERAHAIDLLKTTQADLHQSLSGLSTEQLTYKPDANRWAISECTEHIALVEMGIFRALQKGMNAPADPEKRAKIKVSDQEVVNTVKNRAALLPAPDGVGPAGRFGDTDAALLAFEQQRKTTIEYLQTAPDDMRTHYFDNIVFGTVDAYQAVLMMACHADRHRQQIDEVKTSPGFPQ